MSMPIRRLGGALPITLLSVALAACGGSTPTPAATPAPAQVTPAPASQAPETSPAASADAPAASLALTGRIEVAEHGFAVTLPEGWTRVDLKAGDLDAIMKAAGNVDPALAEQYSAQIQAMLGTGLAVFAFGPDPTSGTNLNVIALPGGGMSLDLLEQLNTAQIEALAGGNVDVERVMLKGGEAIHYRYEMTAAGMPAGTSIDQYLMLAGQNQLIVTATNATEAEAKAIADSVEILD
jgi:hypothetical protein